MKINSCNYCATYPSLVHVESYNPKDSYYFVECPGCYLRGPREESKDDAIDAWNSVIERIRDIIGVSNIKQCPACNCVFPKVIDVYTTEGERQFMVQCPGCNHFGSVEDSEIEAINKWNEGR